MKHSIETYMNAYCNGTLKNFDFDIKYIEDIKGLCLARTQYNNFDRNDWLKESLTLHEWCTINQDLYTKLCNAHTAFELKLQKDGYRK